MLRFRFELRPLREVKPWGADRPTLHWFGLTDGWYWIEAGDHEFLRYTDEAVRRWDLRRPYPDYYVARLWEDLIVLRWALQEPVPADLVPFVNGTFARREFPDADDFGVEVEAAFDFQGDHLVDFGYLTHAPTLFCWRHYAEGRDVVTLSQHVPAGGRGTFAGPPRREVTVPAAEFFDAVDDLDRRLVSAMEGRVAEAEGEPLAGIDLDLGQLRAEHERRRRWRELRAAEPRHVGWAAVRAGAAEIASWPPLELP